MPIGPSGLSLSLPFSLSVHLTHVRSLVLLFSGGSWSCIALAAAVASFAASREKRALRVDPAWASTPVGRAIGRLCEGIDRRGISLIRDFRNYAVVSPRYRSHDDCKSRSRSMVPVARPICEIVVFERPSRLERLDVLGHRSSWDAIQVDGWQIADLKRRSGRRRSALPVSSRLITW